MVIDPNLVRLVNPGIFETMNAIKPNDAILTTIFAVAMATFFTEVVSPRAAIGGLCIFIAWLTLQVQLLNRELRQLQSTGENHK